LIGNRKYHMKDQCVIYYGQIRLVRPPSVSEVQSSLDLSAALDNKESELISDIQGWGMSPRGAGFLFGTDVVEVSSNIPLLG
jgi:hypothetical protein